MLNKITAVTRNGMVAGALTLSVALGAFAPSASAEPRQSSSVDVNAIITLFIGTSYTNVRSGPGTGNAVVEVYFEKATPSEVQTKNIIQRDATFNPHVTTVPTGSYVAFPNEDTTGKSFWEFQIK